MKKIIYWLPRVLALAFVFYLGLFLLDSISGQENWKSVFSITLHIAIPVVILSATAVAWKRDIFGTIAFLFFAAFYVLAVGLGRDWSWYAAVAAPALVISGLFLASWLVDGRASGRR